MNAPVTEFEQIASRNGWFYLLLSSKNDIHEVHVLEGAVLSSFYHLSSEIQRMFEKSNKTANITQAVITLDQAFRLTNILDFISCPTKKRKGNTDECQHGKQYPLESIIKFNINIYSPSNSFETLWISLYQEIKENTLAKSRPHSLLSTGRKR